MSEFAILAPGPSLTPAIASSVGRCIVVTKAMPLRLDADALCANDRAWWDKYGRGTPFKGRKFSTNPATSDIEKVPTTPFITSGTNSALLALHVAISVFGAKRILLYGLDMTAVRGAHYDGPYRDLVNTKPQRFEIFKSQFAAYAKNLPSGVEVWNATPESELKCFPFLN